jgi:hypothetical protein
MANECSWVGELLGWWDRWGDEPQFNHLEIASNKFRIDVAFLK